MDQELSEPRDGEDEDDVEEQLERRDGPPRQIVEGGKSCSRAATGTIVGLTVDLLTSDS